LNEDRRYSFESTVLLNHYFNKVELIHGACRGAWELQEFIESLVEQGHRVQAIDLPGHGKSEEPIVVVTMEAYVNRVIEAAQAIQGQTVLVGHSLAGAIISQVAERIPEKIERLVYVVAAVPRNGETVMNLMQSDEAGELLPKIVFLMTSRSRHWN
jgi:pimeloyl-ACP methyl ester carboxylesterase